MTQRFSLRLPVLALTLLGMGLLAGCGGIETEARYPDDPAQDSRGPGRPTYGGEGQQDSIFGPGGFSLLGGEEERDPTGGGGGINVNAFLWRGALDTIAFMPLSSADPFGGVIITDWYAPPDAPNERFKVNVYILGRALRADGVKASVFRQIRDAGGNWTDTPVAGTVTTELENQILTRARQLRIARQQG
ncbi:DUF3576 domain-containing protein [Roseospirillum parvum]|uniref:DUF3576 domain-containing protein n=1 Tax=Roseospirillum parvum TaxID=83401 RepID=A0A1G8DU45_9PROT|nr:DUF3576 domain-containing protein [Roseospirillum parvum]SDH60970.1 protein of unknown function [Roseospirillum parvum]